MFDFWTHMTIILLQKVFFCFVFFFVWELTGKYCCKGLLYNEQVLLSFHPFPHIIGVHWLTWWWLNKNSNANSSLKELFLSNRLWSHSWVGLLPSLSPSSLRRSQETAEAFPVLQTVFPSCASLIGGNEAAEKTITKAVKGFFLHSTYLVLFIKFRHHMTVEAASPAEESFHHLLISLVFPGYVAVSDTVFVTV